MSTVKSNVPVVVRPLYTIATEIRKDWRSKMYFGAVPYINAMLSLDKLTDYYGSDSARTIVIYFLANAQTWKGDKARTIKAELNSMLKKR